MGHEFTSLVLALLQVGGHPSKAAPELLEQVRALEGEYRFETYFSLSCQNCPAVVGAVGAGFAAVPFIKSWNPSARPKLAGAPVTLDISALGEGQRMDDELRRASWRENVWQYG